MTVDTAGVHAYQANTKHLCYFYKIPNIFEMLKKMFINTKKFSMNTIAITFLILFELLFHNILKYIYTILQKVFIKYF